MVEVLVLGIGKLLIPSIVLVRKKSGVVESLYLGDINLQNKRIQNLSKKKKKWIQSLLKKKKRDLQEQCYISICAVEGRVVQSTS